MRPLNANGRHPRSPRDEPWPRLGETRTDAWVHSAATSVAGFSAICRLGDHSYVVGSGSMPPVTALMRRVRADVEAACLPDNSREISEGSTFSNAREVIMTMSEYEERFRPPAPSLHQTFDYGLETAGYLANVG